MNVVIKKNNRTFGNPCIEIRYYANQVFRSLYNNPCLALKVGKRGKQKKSFSDSQTTVKMCLKKHLKQHRKIGVIDDWVEHMNIAMVFGEGFKAR